MKTSKKILTLAVILIAVMSLCACFSAKEKTFSSDGFSVTLTTDFNEKEYMTFNLYLESQDMIFTGLAENGAGIVTTLSDYTSLVKQANSLTGAEVKDGTGNDETIFQYFFYDRNVSNKDFSYMAVTKAGQNSMFYLFNFACESKNMSKYESTFLSYAKTIVVE